MDSDAAQKDNGRDEDHEMGDAPSQDTSAPASTAAPQAVQASHTDLRFAPPASTPDLPPATNQTTTDPAPPSANPSNTILETTEKHVESQKMATKKKGTAAIKKAPKRAKGAGPKSAKSKKQPGDNASNTAPAQDDEPAGGSDEESDNGPYCICRGPDDHRFMIGCDVCEDWFHGECVNISKDVGEHLIERFVCPLCTEKDPNKVSLFKKICSWNKCIKPARLYDGEPKSNFCSDEHKDMFWEARIAALPAKPKHPTKNAAPQDELYREEIMTLLTSDLAQVDPSDGHWKVNTRPFAPPAAGPESPEAQSKTVAPGILTEEEEKILKDSAAERYKKGEEVVLCQKMLQLMDMANDRRKSLISAKKLDDAACGYDFRLDQVGVTGPFAHWLNSDEAKEIFKTGNLDHGSHLSGDEKNICDKKRCKAHQGWFSIHTRDVRYYMKVLAEDANKLLERERLIKNAAAERKLRKEAENNSNQVVGPDGTLRPAT